MMEASPTSPLEVSKADFLLEFLVIPLDAPPKLYVINHASERDIFGKRSQRVFGRPFLTLWPFDQQPFLGARIICGKRITMRRTHANARKA